MEVLDEPGIIEVDRRRQAAHLPQHVIAERDQHGFQSRPRQAPRELEVADTDPRHLLANRLATDERHSRHRPGALAGEAAGLVLDATLLAE